MNWFKKAYCRVFQTVFRIALPIMPYRNPKLIARIEDIPAVLKQKGMEKPLVITDQNLSGIGATDSLQRALKENGIRYAFFDETFPNPTTDLAYRTADIYRENGCDCLIAFGGGSPMDLTKAVGVCIVKNKPLTKLAGILKVHRKLPLMIAIPTTAGTGSETTLAAVLVDESTHRKFAINDFPLIPRYAVLDPATIHTLPVHIAVTTGLDALTHAVEAYIGRSTTRKTRHDAEVAVRLIFRHLDASSHHQSTKSEKAMLVASHRAGRAFTRSYVGYVHAISHSLSGMYNLPHGWTNAVMLPIILRRYGSVIHGKLARLAICAGLGRPEDGKEILAERFISAIEEKNRQYDLPDHIDAIREEDIPTLASYADKEANPLYPVPVLWDKKELAKIFKEIM